MIEPSTIAERISLAVHSPRDLLRIGLLAALAVAWAFVGAAAFGRPMADAHTTSYDFVVFHAAGRMLLSGGDPYSRDLALAVRGTDDTSVYAYPLAAVWPTLPLLAFPVGWAAMLWVSASIAGLVALLPLAGSRAPRWLWLAPLLFYPSLYSLKLAQYAPIQLALFGLSLWLYRRDLPFWAGLLMPLATVKPPNGISLALAALVLCGSDRRWWKGAILGTLAWYGLPLLLMPDYPLRWLRTMQVYASPGDRQFLLTLASYPDGALCFAATAAIALWSLWKRRLVAVACALAVLAMLITPHRAQYDYPIFVLPLLFLPPRRAWLAMAVAAISWAFPLTYELGWRSSLQLTLFVAAPAALACAFIEARRLRPVEEQALEHQPTGAAKELA